MEEQEGVKNGTIKLPPGFRFHPTDEELVVQYLGRKAFSCPLPASVISEVDVFKRDPWDLPGDLTAERYFFTVREARYLTGCRPNRATDSGYWKSTGSDKQIKTSKGNLVVGMKKLLVFYRGKPPSGSRTDWIMHEYRLIPAESRESILPRTKNSIQRSMVPLEDWVLCRVFPKKRTSSNKGITNHFCNYKRYQTLGKNSSGLIDFFNLNQPSSDSCLMSESSGITEVSSPKSGGGDCEIDSYDSHFC